MANKMSSIHLEIMSAIHMMRTYKLTLLLGKEIGHTQSLLGYRWLMGGSAIYPRLNWLSGKHELGGLPFSPDTLEWQILPVVQLTVIYVQAIAIGWLDLITQVWALQVLLHLNCITELGHWEWLIKWTCTWVRVPKHFGVSGDIYVMCERYSANSNTDINRKQSCQPLMPLCPPSSFLGQKGAQQAPMMSVPEDRHPLPESKTLQN